MDAEYYWWLTWSWSNLLFSCARCNDAGHKANYFPLRRRTRRAARPVRPLPIPPLSPVSNVGGEHPLLLDPTGSEDPLDHIEWRAANTTFNRRDWTWTPLGLTEEGDATVRILKLDELAEDMQDHVRTRLLPSIEEVEDHIQAGRMAQARRRWQQLLNDNLSPKSELSAFTWQALLALVPDEYRRVLAVPKKPGAPRGP